MSDDDEHCSVLSEGDKSTTVLIQLSDSENEEPPVLSPVKPIEQPKIKKAKFETKKPVKPIPPPVISRDDSPEVQIVGVFIPKNVRQKSIAPPHVPGQLNDIRLFLEHAKSLNQKNPLNAFNSLRGAMLCGYFERLMKADNDEIFDTGVQVGSTSQEENYRMLCRFPTDLPEMITCCLYNDGRYALWKDTPLQDEVLIVHVTNDEHFPQITLVGDRMEHVLFHLANKEHELLKEFLPTGCTLSRIIREVHDVRKERNKTKVGSVPTGVGIFIPSIPQKKYQEIVAGAELKKIIIQLGENDKDLKERADEQLSELESCIELANKEGLYGMSLELGQWLWISNFRAVSERAKNALVTAYTNLNRNEFIDIVTDHYSKKENEWKEEEEEVIKRRELALKKVINMEENTLKKEKEQKKSHKRLIACETSSSEYEPPRYSTRMQRTRT